MRWTTLRGESQLRKWIYEYEYGVLWAFGRCDAVQRKLHQVVRGTHYLLGLLPMGNGRCSLFWSQRKDEKERTFANGFDAWKREVVTLCPLAEQIFETVKDFSPVVFTAYQHVWMPRWHKLQTKVFSNMCRSCDAKPSAWLENQGPACGQHLFTAL